MCVSGLKPLIYTVASVILLGTLAIVAIVTCWIRARRSFHNRVIRPNNTPQDYLDYISDNEFTPLTTSEFMASLQERPPTYNQSEEMHQESDSEANSDTRASGATGGGDSSESGAQANLTMTNEGAVVERRRQRGGSAGRERQRRRRRVVIVESDDTRPDESSVTVASLQGGGVVVTQEEGPGNTTSLLQGQDNHSTPQPASATVGSGENSSQGNNVTVLVNVQLPSLELPSSSQSPHTCPTPTQQEIDAIEARVNMLEILSSPPSNDHTHATPTNPSPVISTEANEGRSSNLIDFSSPAPPALPTASDQTSNY